MIAVWAEQNSGCRGEETHADDQVCSLSTTYRMDGRRNEWPTSLCLLPAAGCNIAPSYWVALLRAAGCGLPVQGAA